MCLLFLPGQTLFTVFLKLYLLYCIRLRVLNKYYNQILIMIQIQKELLDAEMELFTSQQDGSDSTAEIQQKVTFFLNLERFFFQCSLTVWSLQDEGVGGVRSFPLSYIILILILSYSETQIIEKNSWRRSDIATGSESG